MTERPILFSGPMVRAILDGRKTQTRRVCKPQPHSVGDHFATRQHGHLRIRKPDQDKWHEIPCPYGQPGDRLWVRETFAGVKDRPLFCGGHIFYRADGERQYGYQSTLSYYEREDRWRPSIHMPRSACRLVLEVKAVRVERLQDISEADAKAEGVTPGKVLESGGNPFRQNIHRLGPLKDGSHRGAFIALWDSINSKRAPWESNPWVWVVEFATRRRTTGRRRITMANGDGVSIEAQRNSAWTCIPGRLCGGGEYVKTLADEIERLTTENGELDACATDYRHEIDRLKIEHGDMNLANVEYEKEIERLTAECSDYKRAAIDAESRLIDLTEELLRRGKENGAIGWPQIRRMVERASVSGSQPPHGAAITMDDGGKVRTILDDAADQRPTTLHDDRCLVHKGADCNCALAALDARRQEQE